MNKTLILSISVILVTMVLQSCSEQDGKTISEPVKVPQTNLMNQAPEHTIQAPSKNVHTNNKPLNLELPSSAPKTMERAPLTTREFLPDLFKPETTNDESRIKVQGQLLFDDQLDEENNSYLDSVEGAKITIEVDTH